MSNTKELRIDNWLSLFQLQMEVDANIERLLLERKDLTLKEFYLLYYLYQNAERDVNMTELEKFIGLSQSAMSRMIMRMEKKCHKVIEAYFLPGNKKEKYVRLTEQGKACYLESSEIVDESLKPIFTGDYLSCLSIKLK